MTTRTDISFADFDHSVREYLREITESEIAEGQEDAQEVLNDLKTDYYNGPISQCYEQGYTVHDAQHDMYYMGQHVLDEDTCIRRAAMIRKKYGELYERARTIWYLVKLHHVKPDDADMDVMRAALQKRQLPSDDDFDVEQWVTNGWLVAKK